MTAETSLLRSSGQIRMHLTGLVGTAGSDYAWTLGTRRTAAQIATAAGLTGMFALGPNVGQRYRGVIIGFMASAASSAVPYRIGGIRRGQISNMSSTVAITEDYEAQLLCAGSFTSSAAGVGSSAGAIVKATEYLADIVTATAATDGAATVGPGADFNAAFGSAGPYAYSPGGTTANQTAYVIIPDCINVEAVFCDFDPGNGVTANWFCEGLV